MQEARGELAARIRTAIQRAGLSQRQLAKILGVNQAAISGWVTGKRAPRRDLLPKIASVCAVSVAYLLGETDDPTPPEAKVLEREAIPLTRRVPLLGRVVAGMPLLAEENIEGWINLPPHIDADFALRVHGDSMEPILRDGQIVFCAHADRREPQHRDMVVAMVDGEATIKWLLRAADGSWFLRAANPGYPDIPLRNLDRVQAVVVDYLGGQPRYPGDGTGM